MRLRLGLPLEEDDGASSLAVRGARGVPWPGEVQNTGATQAVRHQSHRRCCPCVPTCALRPHLRAV